MERRLTKEESEKHFRGREAEIKAWWEGLTHEARNKIYLYHKSIFVQIACQHEWKPICMYDKQIAHCQKCKAHDRNPTKEMFAFVTLL